MDKTKAVLTTALLAVVAAGRWHPHNASAPTQTSQEKEPPGRDIFVPYIPIPTPDQNARQRQLDNIDQIEVLAEMNKLTVELVKRRSNLNIAHADTPKLVKRLKSLAKKLRED